MVPPLMNAAALTLDSRDDLAVALRKLSAGESIAIDSESISVAEDIPAKQKVASAWLRPRRHRNHVRSHRGPGDSIDRQGWA